MRIHLVSDVHGRSDALPAAAQGADALICLGDLLLFLDYADYRRGIFADLFGAEETREFMALRLAKRFDEARELSARLAATLPEGSIRDAINAAAERQYAELFAALPEPAYLTYGNVDVPRMWAGHLKPGHHVLDGARAEIGGWTFGFVGGGLKSRYRTPYEIPDDDYAAKLDALGEVDVLCTHIPPAVPELLYDTVSRRLERGSAALLAAIKRTRPRYAFFGHVHQPLARRVRIGTTECINVGHFNATGEPYVLSWLSPSLKGAQVARVPDRMRAVPSQSSARASRPTRVPTSPQLPPSTAPTPRWRPSRRAVVSGSALARRNVASTSNSLRHGSRAPVAPQCARGALLASRVTRAPRVSALRVYFQFGKAFRQHVHKSLPE